MGKVSARAHRFLRSALAGYGGFLSTKDLFSWLQERGERNQLRVERVPFAALTQWSFEADSGDLVHRSGKFFRVHGVRVHSSLGPVPDWDQPIIDQPEIGILGIVAKEFDGVLHFLMQAKVEPGNVAGVQLTPTVQATRSNYTQVHQGARPPYVDYFLDRCQATVLVDQLQPEQGSTFLRKRNRNIIVEATGDVPVEDEHQWMTLGQIQRLLNVPNLVSMDARTVLSCIPLAVRGASRLLDSGKNPLAVSPFGTALLESMTESGGAAHNDEQILGWLTDLKCRHQLRVERLATKSLQGWTHGDDRIVHDAGRYFEVMAVHVEGVNREVASWDQPLVAPVERGLIGFAVQRIGGVLHFLVQGKIEPGNLDVVAVAPTVQCALGAEGAHDASCRPPFLELMDDAGPGQLRYSCIQSEEGGRFYHVENEYRVVELPAAERLPLPENYTWVTLRQLTELLRFGLVNVEARSLLACLQLVD